MPDSGCRSARRSRRAPSRVLLRVVSLVAAIFLFAPSRNAFADNHSSGADCDRDFRVLSPAKGDKISDLPVEIKLFFPRDARAKEFRAELNGVDVTRRFGPLTNHTRRAFFYRRHLNLGANSFSAHQQGEVARVTFTVHQGHGGPASSAAQPNYAPITTHVVNGNGSEISDYGVQVNGKTYFAPGSTYQNHSVSNGYGFQVLVLDRATLNMVSNTSFGAASDSGVNAMTAALSTNSFYSGCGEFGCLVVVQSLGGIGAAGGILENYQSPVFANIGGSGSLALQSPASAYTLLTSVTTQGSSPAGSGSDRVCSPYSPVCKNAVISGALILDNYSAYTFASPARVTFSTGTAPNSTNNVITVGENKYASSTVASGQGGFQLVVLDASTLTLLSNQTFTPLNATQLNALGNAVSGGCLFDNVNCPLLILSSIGNVTKPASGAALTAWMNATSQLQQSAGATYSLLQDLGPGDDYAMVGYFTPSRTPAIEASSVVSRAIQPQGANTPPSNLRGELILNHQSNYAPGLTNLSSTFNTSTVSLLDATALQAPVAWPYPQPGHTGQQNAYTYFGQLTCGCNDLRSSYNNLNATLSDWYTAVSTATYTANPQFSSTDFGLLQTQLKTELEYARAIQKLENNFNLLYTQDNSNVGLLLTQDYGIVQNDLYVPPPPTTSHVSFGILTGLADLFSLASYITPLGPAVQFGFDAASIAMNTGALFTNNSHGQPAINQAGMLQSTYGSLAGDAANNFADGQEVVGNFFDLILSDWGRMQSLGLPLKQQTFTWDSSVDSAVLDNFDRSTRRQFLIGLMGGVFRIEHDSAVTTGAAPTKFTAAGCTQFSPGVNVTVNNTSVWALATEPFEGQNSYDGFVFWDVPSCPASPKEVKSTLLGPLFAPLDPGDSTKLGEYAPWFYLHPSQVPVYNP